MIFKLYINLLIQHFLPRFQQKLYRSMLGNFLLLHVLHSAFPLFRVWLMNTLIAYNEYYFINYAFKSIVILPCNINTRLSVINVRDIYRA